MLLSSLVSHPVFMHVVPMLCVVLLMFRILCESRATLLFIFKICLLSGSPLC